MSLSPDSRKILEKITHSQPKQISPSEYKKILAMIR